MSQQSSTDRSHSTAPSASKGFSIAAIVCGVVAVLILPIVFGPVGLVLGAVAKKRGESLSTIALVVAGVGMVVGFVIGALGVIALNG